MKHKNSKRTSGYFRLKIKIMLEMLGMLVGAFVLVIALYNIVWAGRGADFMVSVFERLFSMDYEDALHLYRQIFRNNANAKFMVILGVAFLGYLYFFVSRFTHYFNEINKGVDALLQEGDNDIRLSREMQPMEIKLNTVRKNLNDRAEAAREAEQRKNNLVMYLAHDIRTPLTSVIGYLGLLDEAPDMPPEQKAKYVHITLDKAIRLEQLVNEFFEITRYNSQYLTLEKDTVDLHYLLVQLLDEFYPSLAQRGNTAILKANENLAVYGDAAKLARVFNNLLKNAAAYSDPHSEIVVAAQESNGMVQVAFENEGRTIPAEKLSAIFDRFYRLDESRASNTGGAGLGLSIAKDIAEAHGGSITAASENGRTTFTVALPVVTSPGAPPADIT